MFYFLFWFSVALLVLGTVGYPVILWLLTQFKSERVKKDFNYWPKVSIVLPCYNEENYIGKKINNLLSLDYPTDKLEIILVSDGSDDCTEVIIELFLPHPQLKFLALPERKGKPQALNAGVALASGSIVVFSDSRQIFNTTCLREIAPHFADERVGGVSGTLLDYYNPATQFKLLQQFTLITLFRKLENQIKKWESSLHSVVGVYGALYAIRRSLYQPVPAHIILDDMLVPFRIIRQGYRVVFEPAAMAYENIKKNTEVEIERRKRTITGNFQLLFEEKALVSFKNNPVWLQLLSHKFIRLLFPALFFLAFISNLFITNQPFYHATLLGQILFYGFCLLSLVFKKPVIFYIFSKLNITVIQSLVSYLNKSHSVKWRKPGL